MDEALMRRAERQHGFLTVAQVRQAGHEDRLRGRLDRGEWVREQPFVVRPAAWTPTYEARLHAVRLAVEAVGPRSGWCFSHTTAAHLERLVPEQPDDIHVLLPMARRKLRLDDVRCHYTESAVRHATAQGLPVALPRATILQCAAVLPRDQLCRLVEGVLRDGSQDIDSLRALCGRGRSGAAALRSVLDEFDLEGTDHWMRELVRLLVEDGLPAPRLEVPVRDGAQLFAVLDGLYEEADLALEVDDWQSHGPRQASERDRRRDRRLFTLTGITTLRIVPREIRDEPRRVVADVRNAYVQGTERRRRLDSGSTRPDPYRDRRAAS